MNRKPPRGPMPEPKHTRPPPPKQIEPRDDQKQIGVDAAGDPVFAKKDSAIEGPRAGRSSKGRGGNWRF